MLNYAYFTNKGTNRISPFMSQVTKLEALNSDLRTQITFKDDQLATLQKAIEEQKVITQNSFKYLPSCSVLDGFQKVVSFFYMNIESYRPDFELLCLPDSFGISNVRLGIL